MAEMVVVESVVLEAQYANGLAQLKIGYEVSRPESSSCVTPRIFLGREDILDAQLFRIPSNIPDPPKQIPFGPRAWRGGIIHSHRSAPMIAWFPNGKRVCIWPDQIDMLCSFPSCSRIANKTELRAIALGAIAPLNQ